MAASGSRTTIPVITDGYMGDDITSNLFSIDNYPLVSLHYWIGDGETPSGTLKLQVSNYEDSTTDGYKPGNPYRDMALSAYIQQWVDLHDVVNFPVANSFSDIGITSGSPSSGLINLNLAGWKWMRIVYTFASGTGTLNVSVKGKRFSPANI